MFIRLMYNRGHKISASTITESITSVFFAKESIDAGLANMKYREFIAKTYSLHEDAAHNEVGEKEIDLVQKKVT